MCYVLRQGLHRAEGACRWYRPDSHNRWVDAGEAPEELEVDAEHVLKGPAKVYTRWVRVRRCAAAACSAVV